MNCDNVTIVIPAYDESETVGGVVEGLRAAFPESELIVVDDGSGDDTARISREAGAKVISHNANRGYGAALHTGTSHAGRDYVLFCDSDGQHSVEDVGRIIEACDNHDMVAGTRGQESHVQLSRRPGKFILRLFANFLAGEKIPDINTGLRIVRRETLVKYLHLMPRGFSFSTTTTFTMIKTNRRIKWVPITVQKRVGSSTVRQWKHGPQTLMLMLRLSVLFEPLKVFLSVSAVLFFLALLSFSIDLSSDSSAGIGDTTVLLGISTLIIFMFGLLCDQVAAIRRESHE